MISIPGARRATAGAAFIDARAVVAIATVAVLAMPNAAPAQAPTPAERRARELVTLVVERDFTRLAAWLGQNLGPEALRFAPADEHARRLLSYNAGKDRLELRGIRADGATRAVAALANPLSEEVDSFPVVVEAEAPHRIARFGVRDGAGGALSPLAFATDAERVRELQRFVRKQAADGIFSGVVLVAKEGKPIYHEAFGIANRDTDTPVRLDTKFNLGSANKNFTAIVIGQLVEEGKLSWDDPLSKFLPDFPDSASAKKIRIKHLLSHTAGLGSYFNQQFVESSRARWRTVDDMMRLARPDSLRFEPGTRFAYSNTGFLVLGKVIEIVTGRDYFDVVRERIYKRAGMLDSDAFDLDRVNKSLAVGYLPEYGPSGVTWRNNVFEHVIRGGPAGGGYATKVLVPAGQCMPVPAGIDLVTAAALPEVACTVWSNVF
ncbi:MAG: serine hydrolase, partial [Gemmatimonadota bacterium]